MPGGDPAPVPPPRPDRTRTGLAVLLGSAAFAGALLWGRAQMSVSALVIEACTVGAAAQPDCAVPAAPHAASSRLDADTVETRARSRPPVPVRQENTDDGFTTFVF